MSTIAAAAAATNITMEIPGITDSEAAKKANKTFIDLLHFSITIIAPERDPLGGTVGHGRPHIDPIPIAKPADLTTPQLQQVSLRGDIFPTITIKVHSHIKNDKKVVIRTITLSKAKLLNHGYACADSMENESYAIDFRKIYVEFSPYDTNGNPLGKTTMMYDLDEVKTSSR